MTFIVASQPHSIFATRTRPLSPRYCPVVLECQQRQSALLVLSDILSRRGKMRCCIIRSRMAGFTGNPDVSDPSFKLHLPDGEDVVWPCGRVVSPGSDQVGMEYPPVVDAPFALLFLSFRMPFVPLHLVAVAPILLQCRY